MPQLEDPDGFKSGQAKKMPKAGKDKSKMACNHTKEGVECPVHGSKGCPNITCLLYTSPSPRDRQKSRMPSSA